VYLIKPEWNPEIKSWVEGVLMTSENYCTENSFDELKMFTDCQYIAFEYDNSSNKVYFNFFPRDFKGLDEMT